MDDTQWYHAIAAHELGLNFGNAHQIEQFQNALCENTLTQLKSAYTNLTGFVPGPVCEFINSTEDLRRIDVARALSNIRYNFLALCKRPVRLHQVRSVAERALPPNFSSAVSRRKTYIQTRKRLVANGMTPLEASAVSFHVHLSTVRQSTPLQTAVKVDIVAELSDLDVTNTYLMVDCKGGVHMMDTVRGTYMVETPGPVPCGWLFRVSTDTNTFIAGDAERCVRLRLDDAMETASRTPVHMPNHPATGVRCVANRWLVWGSKQRPFSFEYMADDTLRACTADEARSHLISVGTTLNSSGNDIMYGCDVLAQLPSNQVITFVAGDSRVADCFTSAGDFWRVDVRSKKTTCVGLPIEFPIVAADSMVSWV